MINFKDLVDAIIDVALDPSQVTIYVHHGSIFPVVDYRLDDNRLHLINFRSNDFIEDVVTLEELIKYVAIEGFELEEVTLEPRDFEVVEERILLF